MSQLTDDILNNTDIVDVVSKYVPLKRAGSNFTGNCPFHNEKTPSFMVSPAKQIFKCFGCGKGGNVITFVQEIERIDFRDTIKELAKSSNIDLEKYQLDSKKIEEYADEKEKIKRIHKLAQDFFVGELTKNQDAIKYLKEERKLTEKMIKDFGIGYAPDSHYALLSHIKSKGFTDADLIQASLAKKGQSQDSYSFFRNRIMFPIYDTMQNIIGFSARIINPNDKPKYLNSGEHKAFEKSNILYGLNWAKNQIKVFDYIIIVEGQMDVIGLARLDFPIGVATCGTSITAQHIKLLKRYTERIYMLFDNDVAGQTATIRALNIAYQHDIFPKQILLPETAKDVDDLANLEDGKEIFSKCIENSVDGFMATFQQLINTNDISSPINKQKIINTMLGLILNINNVPMQDHYLHILGDKLNTSYEIILTQYKQYAKNEGKFQLRQNQSKETTRQYQPDRKELLAALLIESFIQPYIQTPELRSPIQNLIEKIKKLQTTEALDISTSDISELQLRWEKELQDRNETKQLQIIKQTIGVPIQEYIKQILKSKSVSPEDKQDLLQLKRSRDK